MAMGFMGMLMMLLTSGGGNDLLDYLPTDAYWKAKGVEITVEAMAAELKGAEPADVAGGVRRLMAIRALGELKKPAGLAALRPLLASKKLFVADYAKQAAATIEGKPYTRPVPDTKTLWKDVCLLPADCAVVAQVSMAAGKPLDFAALLKGAAAQLPPAMGMDQAAMMTQLAQMLTMAAERVGNVRIHAITLGVSGDVGDKTGHVAIIARGIYNAEAVKVVLGAAAPPPMDIDGATVFSPQKQMHLIPCSNERFVGVFGPRQAPKPTKTVVAALKANGDRPAFDDAMQALVKGIDTSLPMWAAMRMSEHFRQAPLLAPFDSMTLTGKPDAEGVTALKVVARGADAQGVKGAVDEFNAGLEKAKAGIGQALAQMPSIKPIADFIHSIRMVAKDAEVTVTGSLKGQGVAMAMPLVIFLRSTANRPAPPRPVRPEQRPSDF